MENSRGIEKIRSFQGLRGLGIILIILSHCEYIKNCYGGNVFGWAGALGVSVFIFLSGYLAVWNIHNTEKITIKKIFLVAGKKAWKFYPLHLLTLLAALPFSIRFFVGSKAWKWGIKFLLNILLLQAWVPVRNVYFAFNSVSWYLSLTMFFVFISSLMVKLTEKMHDRTIISMIIAVEILQIFLVQILGAKSWTHWCVYICPLTRCLDFFVGGVYAYLYKEDGMEKYRKQPGNVCFFLF